MLVLVGVGCGGDLRIGGNAQLTCESDDDCPAPMTCVAAANRCVLPGVVIDVTPPIFIGASASVERMGADDEATITLTFDEDIVRATISVEAADATVDDAPLEAVTIDGSTVTAIVDGGTLSSGPLVLTVSVANSADLSLETRVPTGVVVDIDAPEVVIDDVVVESVAGNPLFPGRTVAARVDSTVEVTVTWSEAVAADAATEVTLTDSAGAVVALDVSPVSTGSTTTFDVEPEDFADLADGEIIIAVTVVDDVGNSAVRSLPTPLIKDTTPPPAPTFSRLRRTPFGDDTAAVLTEVEGNATDAVVVLAVPAGVTVGPLQVPAHVARIAPEADGSLALGVEIDVPGMRLVSVDAAGNQGEPAAAAITDLVASTAIPVSPHQLLARPAVAESLQQRGDVRIDNDLRDDPTEGVTSSSSPFWRPLTSVNSDQPSDLMVMAGDPIGGGILVVANGQTFRLRGSQLTRLDVPILPVQRGYAIATDERRGRVVLFGGLQFAEPPLAIVRNDLFEWDGARWIHVLENDPAPGGSRPSPRVGHGAGYVAAEGGVVVVNGCGGAALNFAGCPTPLPPEVWVWDGATFVRRCQGDDCGDAPQPIRPEITVDTDGVMIATGGTGNAVLIGSTVVKRFENGTFVGRCGDDCAQAIPADGYAHFNVAAQAPAFLGTCDDGVCIVTVNADDTTTTTLIQSDRGLPALNNELAARGFVVDGDRLLVQALENPNNRILVVEGGQLGQAFPSTLTPRCGGAAALVGDELQVMGGCTACPLGAAELQCSTPVSAIEAPLSARSPRGAGPVSGNTIAVPSADNTTIISWQIVAEAGAMEVRKASDLNTAQTIPLGEKRYVAAAVSPNVDANIVVVTALSDVAQFPPALFIVEPIEVLDTSGADAVFGPGCESGCGLNRSTGSGVAAATTRGGQGVLFGGTIGGLLELVDATVVFDALGQGTSLELMVKPPPRQWAMAAYDPQRELTWLFGGTTNGEAVTGNGSQCQGPGTPAECGDLWTFDGDNWSEVRPVDILGAGAPTPRFRGQLGVVDGRVAMTGGAVGSLDNVTSLDDGWVLEASTTTPPSHQLSASFAAYGTDAEQTFAGLFARWCGVAHDATGAEVPVIVRAFAGGSWRVMDSDTDADGCVNGELDVDGIVDVVVREPGHTVVVEVVPVLTTPGRDAPSITTTVLTATSRYAATP